MKKQLLITAIFILGCFNLFAENKENIVLYENVDTGETVTVGFNKKGIINKIEGSMESFSFRDITITEKKENEFEIKLGYTFNRAIYHDIIVRDDSVLVISTDLLTGEKTEFNVKFGDNEYFIKDDYASINLISPTSFKCVFDHKLDTIIPTIEFDNNVAYLNTFNMYARGFKYKYHLNKGKYKIIFYGQYPEEGWDYHNTFNIGNIKSKDQIVNLVNSIILNMHNDIIGCMMFPILMGDFIK